MRGLHQVRKQLELLSVLARHTVEDAWALAAIEDATKEVERVTSDGPTVRYAREIRLAATCRTSKPGQLIRESPIGERIEWLADHCKLLGMTSAGEIDPRVTSA
jgi:hypothetical protein